MKRILLMTFVLLGLAVTASWAQRAVTGKVVDAKSGLALPGVAVRIENTSQGTVTDVDGNYRLEVPSNDAVLLYSFIGYADQRQTVGSRSTIDVKLAEDIEQLEEVVVTAFGVEREKKALGYAVQDVSGEKLTEAREANLVNALSGRVAGVTVTSASGAPGASSRIVLRGASSLTGNNQPLFIVDGIPIDNGNYGNANQSGGADLPNGAADINPNDIETISVLKGANAAALYGSRAANGVILITTKSGRNVKGIGVTVNSNVTFETPLRLPSYQNTYGGGYNQYYYEWVDGSSGSGGEDESWGPALDQGLEFIQWNSYTVDGAPLPWVSQPNNVRDFFETGSTITNNVALVGGNEKVNFRLSLTDFRQDGMIPTTELNRKTVSLNTGVEITEDFRAEASINYVSSGSDNVPEGGYNGENPMQQFTWFQRNVDINALRDYQNLPLSPEGTQAAGTPLNWNTNFNNNPFWILDNNRTSFAKDRFYGNIRLNYEFTDNLSLMVRTGTDFFTDLQEIQRAVGTNENPYGYYGEIDRTRYEVNTDVLLSYNDDITEEIGLNVAVGGNLRNENYSRNQIAAPELEIPGVYNVSNSRIAVTAANYDERKQVQSLLGTAELSFRNYLFLNLTARNDWSSTLPIENNSYFYPSASLSAVLSDIFEIDSDVLSYLKVRGGWAQVGSDTSPYRLRNVYGFFDPWGGSLIQPTTSNILNNPELRPEITTSVEIGADARFFNNRAGLDVTYYDATSTDQIVLVDISGASGFSSIYDNVGEMRNRGIEVQLNATPIETDNFTWLVNVNYAKNVNEVVTLGGDLETLRLGGQWSADIVAAPGVSYPAIYGTDFQRDAEGNIIHSDGLPLLDNQLKILAEVTPDWVGGVSTEVSYKGISFGALVDGKFGGSIYSMTNAWGRYAGVLEETLIGRETGIIGDGVMNIGSEESPNYVPNNIVRSARDYNHAAFGNSVVAGSVFDASFVKLRQLTLGYTIPTSILGNLPFRDVRVSLVGRNLAFLYVKAPHIDPETAFSNGNDQGIEHAQLPSARSYGINLSVNF